MLENEKTTLTTPTFFDFKSFFLPDSTRFEHIRKFYPRKLKKFEIKAKQTSKNGDVTFSPVMSNCGEGEMKEEFAAYNLV